MTICSFKERGVTQEKIVQVRMRYRKFHEEREEEAAKGVNKMRKKIGSKREVKRHLVLSTFVYSSLLRGEKKKTMKRRNERGAYAT